MEGPDGILTLMILCISRYFSTGGLLHSGGHVGVLALSTSVWIFQRGDYPGVHLLRPFR